MATIALNVGNVVARVDGRREQAERERREERATHGCDIAGRLAEDQWQQHEAVLDPLFRTRELEQRAHGVSALRPLPVPLRRLCALR